MLGSIFCASVVPNAAAVDRVIFAGGAKYGFFEKLKKSLDFLRDSLAKILI